MSDLQTYIAYLRSLTLGDLLCHPLNILNWQVLISGATLGLTNENARLRFLVLPLLVTCSTYIVYSASFYLRVLWAAPVAAGSVGLVLHYLDLAIFHPITFNDPITDFFSVLPSPLPRILAGVKRMSNLTHTGTPQQVRGIPPWSHEDPSYVPTKAAFLRSYATTFCLCFITVDAITYIASLSTQLHQKGLDMLTPEHVHFFSNLATNLTLEALAARLIITLSFGSIIVLGINLVWTSAALGAVGSGLSRVEDWPPAFDSPLEAYSLRQFWGHCWHQQFRRPFGSFAGFITSKVLRLRPRSQLANLVNLYLVFAISGVVHVLCEIGGGLKAGRSGAFRFFVMQAVGIMLEDFFEKFVHLVLPSTGSTESSKKGPSTLGRIVGIAWTLAFITWTAPGWISILASNPIPKEGPLLFGVVQPIAEWIRG